VRIGLLGAGRIGSLHAGTLSADDRVEGLVVADVDPDRAAAVAARHGAEAADPDDLFERVDAVVIASSTDTHVPYLLRAAERRLPVFCEKPIALDLPTTRRAMEAADAAGIPVQVGFQRRFDAEHLTARSLIESGAAGDLYLVHSMTHDPEPPPREYIPRSGGFHKDTLVHDIDAVRYVTGREVVEVYADGAVLVDPVFAEFGDHDVAVVTLRLDGGVPAVLTASRRQPLGYDVRMTVYGSKDTLGIGYGPGLPVHRLVDDHVPDDAPPSFIERFAGAYRAEMAAFLDVAAGRRPTPCSIRDAYEVLRVAEACDRSYAEHRPVSLEEVT